jgi:hypothetical protein
VEEGILKLQESKRRLVEGVLEQGSIEPREPAVDNALVI